MTVSQIEHCANAGGTVDEFRRLERLRGKRQPFTYGEREPVVGQRIFYLCLGAVWAVGQYEGRHVVIHSGGHYYANGDGRWFPCEYEQNHTVPEGGVGE